MTKKLNFRREWKSVKKLIQCIIALAVMFSEMNAQTVKVTYREEMKVAEVLQQINDPQIAAAVEKQLKAKTKTMELLYSKGESIYRQEATASDNSSAVYKNMQKRICLSKESIIDRPFLIRDDFTAPKWEFINESMEICGLKCQKAIDSTGVTAWYCPEIPINDGPYRYFGLPGLILKIENKGKIFTAENVQTKDVETSEIKPLRGKAISREEFEKIKKQKLQEFGVNGSTGNGSVKIITM